MSTRAILDKVVSEIYEALRVNDTNKVLSLIDKANQLRAELEAAE
jgi:hypothetical protein